MEKLWDLIVVGGGPAGLTAALYAVRSGKRTMIIEKDNFGGQIVLSDKLENYPAIAKISGEEFAESLMSQCSDLGVEFELGEVVEIEKSSENFKIKTSDGGYYGSHAVILATGTKKRELGLEREEFFQGNGISYCALCDGAFYAGEEVAVVGGGNSAVEEALMLSDICKKVYIIHRRDKYRAEEKSVEAMRSRANIKEVLNSEILSLNGDESLSSVSVKNKLTGEITEIKISGLFVLIGNIASNSAFKSLVSLDSQGFFDVDEGCKSSTEGLFVAGDCRRKEIRQIVTAVSDGAVAASKAIKYLDSK